MSQPLFDTPLQKEFYKNFEYLTIRQDRWRAWDDFVTISQHRLDIHKSLIHDPLPAHITDFYHEDEWQCFRRMLDITTETLNGNPEQDFLGDLYMRLGMANSSAGEVFTPYSLCRAMTALVLNTDKCGPQGKEWFSVLDPACGAGATLIAFANECSKRSINYKNQVLFVAQDINQTIAGMCFIQLSLLDCGGYVVVGDSLKNPIIGENVLRPSRQEGQQIWYTPAYYVSPWSDRIVLNSLNHTKRRKEGNINVGNNEKANSGSAENHEPGEADV